MFYFSKMNKIPLYSSKEATQYGVKDDLENNFSKYFNKIAHKQYTEKIINKT